MDLTLWHNPRCSKSRAALALLTERGLSPTIRLYLNDPPSEAELRALLDRLGKTPGEVIRRSEAAFKEQGLKSADDTRLLEAMLAHPKLIERPILDTGTKAVIGRPPEAILALL